MGIGEENTLEFKDVTFRYSSRTDTVISNLSFNLKPGDILWLLGDNGSGKSTVGGLLSGENIPEVGSISINGHNSKDWTTFERPKLIFSVAQRVFLGMLERTIGRELETANRKGITLKKRHTDRAWIATAMSADEYGIGRYVDFHPLDLGHSVCWRTALAIGTFLDPIVLFVDELPNLCGKRNRRSLLYTLTQRQKCRRLTIVTAHEDPDLGPLSSNKITLSNNK